MVLPCSTNSSALPFRRQPAVSQQVGQQQQQQHRPQQQLPQQHCQVIVGRRDPMQQPTADTAALSRRRELLCSGVASLAGYAAVAPLPSQAAVTITMRPKLQLKPYTLKAGYTVTAPDTWGLAYVSVFGYHTLHHTTAAPPSRQVACCRLPVASVFPLSWATASRS